MSPNSHDLPKLVASTPVGKEVAIVIVRKGHELTKTVKLGRLEDGDQKASRSSGDDLGQEPKLLMPPAEKALGMALSTLDETSRLKYAIKDRLTAGVVVTGVEFEFPGGAEEHPARRGDPGSQSGSGAGPSRMSRKMRALKSAGKKLALLLVSTPQGEVRFVAINL